MAEVWRRRRVEYVSWLAMAKIWAWIWVMPCGMAFAIRWAHASLGMALESAMGLYGIGIAMSGLAAGIYNWMTPWVGGIQFWQEADHVNHVDWVSALRAGALPLWVAGLGVGFYNQVIPPPFEFMPNRSGWDAWVGVPAAALGAWSISIALYNRVVVPFGRSLAWTEEPSRGAVVRVVQVDPDNVRLVVGLWTFAWAGIGLVVAAIGVLVILTIHAALLPAGFFGIGASIFTAFVLAILGLLGAVAVSYWLKWGALLYNRWARRGGGLSGVFRDQSTTPP